MSQRCVTRHKRQTTNPHLHPDFTPNINVTRHTSAANGDKIENTFSRIQRLDSSVGFPFFPNIRRD
jgi:hypothetical protein